MSIKDAYYSTKVFYATSIEIFTKLFSKFYPFKNF